MLQELNAGPNLFFQKSPLVTKTGFSSWPWDDTTFTPLENTVVASKQVQIQSRFYCAFYIKSVIFDELAPEGTAILWGNFNKAERNNQEKRPELWGNGFILYQNNASLHVSLSLKQFLIGKIHYYSRTSHIWQFLHFVTFFFPLIL